MASLQQVLLLGTERMPGTPQPAHPALTSAWEALDWSRAPETAFLDATALAGSAALAGNCAVTDAAYPAPALEEELREAPAAAATVLRQVLESDWRALLIEWLEACATSGYRAPAFYLPRLLTIAEGAERKALATVAGERGRWLAEQNPAWQWLGIDAVSSLVDWETGSELQRLAALRELRKTDPAAARGLVEKTWSEDPGEFRAKALSEFAINLSSSDEPFLEKCLRDRRREIRGAAQRLLAALGESAFSRRMQERAQALVRLEVDGAKRKLEITLPNSFDPTWKADGIEEKTTTGAGEKASWVRQILECVRPRHWMTAWSINADELASVAQQSDWANLLLGAWFETLFFAPDADIATALFGPVVHRGINAVPGLHAPQIAATLIQFCPPERRWILAAAHAENAPVLWAILSRLEGAPELNAAQAVLRGLAPAIRDGFVPGGSPQAVLAARRIPTGLRDEAERLVQREDGLTKTAEAFLRALELRRQIQAAFSTTS